MGFASISHIKVTDLETHLTHLSDEFAEIDDEITYKEQESIILDNPKKGFYSNIGIGTSKPDIYTSGGFYTKDIEVDSGEVYEVSCSLGGVSMHQIIFWDSNDICVSVINKGDNTIKTLSVNVPDTAVLMSVCSKKIIRGM